MTLLYMHNYILMQMDGMKKVIIILIISAFFLHSITTLTYNSRNIAAESTLPKYFVDDDFNSSTPGWQNDHFDRIQDAIDEATSEDRIIVYEGTYEENIIIDKPISLFGEDLDLVIIDGGQEGSVVTIESSNVDFSTFTIKNSGTNATDAGIKIISSSKHCQIVENKITDCVYGLYVDRCDNTIFSQNFIYETTNATFFISSDDNTIEHNYIYDNDQHGIFLNRSCEDNIIKNNTVNGNGWYGIYLNDNCIDNTISENIVFENDNTGIRIEDSVSSTVISRNEVYKNTNYGIFVVGSQSEIIRNNVYGNEKHGIFLFADDSTSIMDNTVYDNILDGIRLQNSTSDVVLGNSVKNNVRYGIYVNYYCIKNQIYDNYFLGNLVNAKDISPETSENEWYHDFINESNIIFGPVISGNFWDDYNGTDEDRDGFGETAYRIPGGNKIDLRPLVHRRPIASAEGPYIGSVFEHIEFDGSESSDIDEIMNLTYYWEFEDGYSCSGIIVRHMFERSGNYTVTLTVVNEYGGSDTDITYVIVTPDKLPPTIEILTNELVVTDSSTLYTIKANIRDNVGIKNVTLSYWTDNESNIQTALMNEKSGNIYEKTIIFSTSKSTVHCVITAIDASDNSIDTKNPFAVFSCESQVNVSETIGFDASDSFDLDGEIISFEWNFGDGIIETSKKTSHKYATDGNYTVTLTVEDDEGNTGLLKQIVLVQPSEPVYASNDSIEMINEKGILSTNLTEPFMSYDTSGDGVLDMFVDPNGEIKLVSVVSIDEEETFLLSINDSFIPEFFWQPDLDKIRWITHVIPSVSEENVAIDYQVEEATLTIDVDKSGWIWIDVNDILYANASIKTIRDTTNKKTISDDMIWRENNRIYILDDPSTRYYIVFENIFPSISADFIPGDSGILDEFQRTITVSYNVPVSILYATFNGLDVTDHIKILDDKRVQYTPPGYYANGTYSFIIDAEAQYGNKVSSESATYFYFQYQQPPQPSFLETYGLMILLMGLVLGGGLFYGVCKFKGLSFDSYVYLKNRRLFPFIKPVIFGPMSVTVEKENVTKAEFYVDGCLKGTICNEPFVWQWNEPGFLNHSIEAKLFDGNGNNVSSGEMSVFIINPFKWNPDYEGHVRNNQINEK